MSYEEWLSYRLLLYLCQKMGVVLHTAVVVFSSSTYLMIIAQYRELFTLGVVVGTPNLA
jgi:hypothetical protein